MSFPVRQQIIITASTPQSNHDHLRSLTAETTSQLDVLRLDGDTLGMNGAEIGVLEERDEVSLNGLLESTDGR
jgi:hypothetical protein